MKPPQTKLIDIGPMVEQLLNLMRQFPGVRDDADMSLGRKTVHISVDSVYFSRMLDPTPLRKMQRELLREAIDDIAGGAPVLMHAYLGIKSDGARFKRVSDKYANDEPLIFKIGLNDALAFQNQDGTREFDLHEKTANAAIYFLIDQLCLAE